MSKLSFPLFDLLARYRLGLSFLVFLLIVLEWQINDGGRPHALSALQDGEHPAGLLLIFAGLGLRSWAAMSGDMAMTCAHAASGTGRFRPPAGSPCPHPLTVTRFSAQL